MLFYCKTCGDVHEDVAVLLIHGGILAVVHAGTLPILCRDSKT